jgi:cytosine permease
MTFSAAVTMVFGTFASGATQATNWTRLSRSGRVAVIASVVAFLLGNGLMVVAGAWCAMVYQQADIVEVMMLQGLSFAAVVMLCLNLWTIQGPTIYNVSAAACHCCAASVGARHPGRGRGGHRAGDRRHV